MIPGNSNRNFTFTLYLAEFLSEVRGHTQTMQTSKGEVGVCQMSMLLHKLM